MRPQIELINKIKEYNSDVDEELIAKAYVFGQQAHATQMRASGEPYFSHPIEVAYFLTSLKVDSATIITALLHDTVEDTEVTLEDIEQEFGAEVGKLVDGVTKLNRLEIKSDGSKQAENFRKLVVAMSEDLRVLLVKLSDRLHNMGTLHFIKKSEKRERIARETLDIYAPLAERIGMRQMKEDLQDLSFAELYTEARDSIVKRLEFLRKQGKTGVSKSENNIKSALKNGGVKSFTVTGREKKPYSIWKKMENKNITFEQLSDIVAFRVIVDNVTDCYSALGVIHTEFHMIPERFKDYISTPKANGYQSIHTSVFSSNQQRIEVQIRTQEMHDIAEYGVAAHWSYKQDSNYQLDGRQFRWVRELLDILDKTEDAEEFMENTRLEMYHDQVFCFSPKGDIIVLPKGATPVDFAFSIHSDVGRRCIGAKVNQRIVPLKTKLKNGDQVDVITSKNQTPSPAWERFVITGKARSEIRKFVRIQQRDEYVNLGKAILQKTFKQENKDISDKILEAVLADFSKKTVEDLYAEVGEGLISRAQVFSAVFGNPLTNSDKAKKPSILSKILKHGDSNTHKHAMPITGLIPGMAIHFAGCCHPIPGDQIVGIVTTGKGITIHTMDCDTLENFSDTPERWIDVAWDKGAMGKMSYVSRIKAHISHESGSMATLANVISREDGNINNIKITNRSSDFFEIIVDIEVDDEQHLQQIITGLRAKDIVQSVERNNG